MVECDLAKVEVAGSNPVSRSIVLPCVAHPEKRIPISSKPLVLLALIVVMGGCGDSRKLQSVAISPTAATSQAQFTATGTFSKPPSPTQLGSADITWCAGSSNGICAGFTNPGAMADANGNAQCEATFHGTVTVLGRQPKATRRLSPTAKLCCSPSGRRS